MNLTSARHRSPRTNAAIVLLAVLVVMTIAWLFVRSGSAGGGGGRGARPVATVGVAKAAPADIPVTVSAIGTVQPMVTATVRTQLAGVLFAIDFTEGQLVRKGQLLAQIDPRPYRLALLQAEGNLTRDQAQLNVARVDLIRYQTLLRQDSIARQQVDTQVALVKQYEGTVAADRAQVGSARLNIEYTKITAPVAGRVGLREVDLGNYLTPSDANGVVVITQTDPIDVAFSVPQDVLPSVRARAAEAGGLAVAAFDQSGATKLADGHFLTFDNQIDATTGTIKAKARFANPGGALFPNQFVNVSLLVETLRGVTSVPVSAVRHGAQGDFIFLLQPDRTVKLQVIKTGPSDNGRVAVLSGVPAGATVITEGADNLDDGSKVMLPGDKPHAGGGKGGGAHRRGHKGAAA